MLLRKYGVETTIDFPLITFGGSSYKTGATIAAGDAKISKNGGEFVATTNLFTQIITGSGYYTLVLTATEMQAARVVIKIVDQTATKEWQDQSVIIETYGNASALHYFAKDVWSQTGFTLVDDSAGEMLSDLKDASNTVSSIVQGITESEGVVPDNYYRFTKNSLEEILSQTGITEGGTWTFGDIVKILVSILAGKVRTKSGSATIKEILDPEDDTTPIAEVTLSATTPYRSITIL